MKNNRILFLIAPIIALVVVGLAWFGLTSYTTQSIEYQTMTVETSSMKGLITASGTVHSATEVNLHFQIAGKLVSVPLKEGDSVSAGQTIAQLDTTTLQNQLAQALNTYQTTRDQFDQTQANNSNSTLQQEEKAAYAAAGATATTTNTGLYDIVQRILDENQLALNSSVASVNLANYALQLATLTSPINGIVTHEDVNTPGVNVLTTTTYAVADPKNLIFKADVLASDIDDVALGAPATITLANTTATYSGTVTHIYPQVQTVGGQDVYVVDVTAGNLTGALNLGQNGSVTIARTAAPDSISIPNWVVLGHSSVWVLRNGQPTLIPVTVGSVQDGMTTISSGLSAGDKIITDPQMIIRKEYPL